MFETAKEYLEKLRGSNKVWVKGVLNNTLNREGNQFWYQLRQSAAETPAGAESAVYLQFKAAGEYRAKEYIANLNKTQDQYKYVITGTVAINCPKVEHTVTPPCPTCPK